MLLRQKTTNLNIWAGLSEDLHVDAHKIFFETFYFDPFLESLYIWFFDKKCLPDPKIPIIQFKMLFPNNFCNHLLQSFIITFCNQCHQSNSWNCQNYFEIVWKLSEIVCNCLKIVWKGLAVFIFLFLLLLFVSPRCAKLGVGMCTAWRTLFIWPCRHIAWRLLV